jgi:flagellar biosynthesis repressor protein FlbT
MHITLRTNEKIYVNGAVLRADRKVSLELMNDAVFLLENHIMQEKDATTPLRQWYFVVQLMLMEGVERPANREMFERHGAAMAGAYADRSILEAMAKVANAVERKRYFEALKIIRSVLPIEDAIINPAPALAEAS